MNQETKITIGEQDFFVRSEYRVIERMERAFNEYAIPLATRFQHAQFGATDVFKALNAILANVEDKPSHAAIKRAISKNGIAHFGPIIYAVLMKGVAGEINTEDADMDEDREDAGAEDAGNPEA